MVFRLTGLSPSSDHGIHIHEKGAQDGKCEATGGITILTQGITILKNPFTVGQMMLKDTLVILAMSPVILLASYPTMSPIV
jgi:hypothetical protein